MNLYNQDRAIDFHLLDLPLPHRPALMFVSFLVCSARPVSLFANISSSVEEDGALITWEYWGPEKNVYVEYIAENSKKNHLIDISLSFRHGWQETPTSLLASAGD